MKKMSVFCSCAHRPQLRADAAEAVVHRGDHRERLPAFLGQMRGRFREPRLRRFQRHVRRHPREVEKPRLARRSRRRSRKDSAASVCIDDAEAIVAAQVRRIGKGLAIEACEAL